MPDWRAVKGKRQRGAAHWEAAMRLADRVAADESATLEAQRRSDAATVVKRCVRGWMGRHEVAATRALLKELVAQSEHQLALPQSAASFSTDASKLKKQKRRGLGCPWPTSCRCRRTR